MPQIKCMLSLTKLQTNSEFLLSGELSCCLSLQILVCGCSGPIKLATNLFSCYFSTGSISGWKQKCVTYTVSVLCVSSCLILVAAVLLSAVNTHPSVYSPWRRGGNLDVALQQGSLLVSSSAFLSVSGFQYFSLFSLSNLNLMVLLLWN